VGKKGLNLGEGRVEQKRRKDRNREKEGKN